MRRILAEDAPPRASVSTCVIRVSSEAAATRETDMDPTTATPRVPAQRVPAQPFLTERCTFACGALLDDDRAHTTWHASHPAEA
jgi:hypothetical protein